MNKNGCKNDMLGAGGKCKNNSLANFLCFFTSLLIFWFFQIPYYCH